MSETTQSSGVRRREFLKVLGVTGAATAAVGCSSDRVEKLIPYLNHPDNTVPGVSTYYATTCRECAAACGILAETRDGRTIKLEGNPAHPLNRGALCARGQAALQGLYNPDRFRAPMMRRTANGPLEPTTWDEALRALAQRLGSVAAANALFVNRHETGSFPAFLDGWLSAMGMPAHLSWDPIADVAVAEANRQSFGVAWPRLDFDAARLVVSFGADFLDDWGASVPQQLDFADARAKVEGAPRLVYVGPRRSLTGLNADEWIPCRPGTELAIVGLLRGEGDLNAVAQATGVEANTLQRLVREVASARPAMILAGATTADATELALAVNALNQQLGAVGTTIRTDEPIAAFEGMASTAQVAAAVERMRAGQVSAVFFRGVNPVFALPRSANVADAIRKVALKVSFSPYPDETTELCDFILPDHHALESWGDAQATPTVMSLQQPAMEPVFDTRQTADVLIALAKANPAIASQYATPDYRSWLITQFPGGSEAFARALQSAVVRGGRANPRPAAPALVAAAPAAPTPLAQQQGDKFLVVYPSPVLGADGANKPWLQELADPVTKIAWQSWVELHPDAARELDVDNGELVRVQVGESAIEAPAYIYPGIRADTVAIAFGRGHRATRTGGSAVRYRGYPEDAVMEGYGRYAKDVGINPLDLLPMAFDARSGQFAWTSSKARVTKAGGYDELVTTEGSARQHGRGIAQAILVTDLGVREGAGAERANELSPQGSEGGHAGTGTAGASGGVAPGEHGQGGQVPGGPEQGGGEHGGGHEFPGDASHEFLPGLRSPVAQDAQGALPSDDNMKGMYDPEHWSGMAKRRWAMTIDLARCTGCSACVTACYAENNLPTVGAPYQHSHSWGSKPKTAGGNIIRGREMTWIRLERYWEGDETSPSFEARFVPMLCQHCGNAPCEPVCPVYATYHSPDGLNVQVYNRCVGTRYCSNNCPYKVRYFNWFGYGEPARPQYAWPEPLNWQLNPDVTVRGKGVMEKCTFCVQRIREAENRAKLEGRELRADEFTVACAQACPSRAITFGDAADEGWTVARLANDRRAYHVFEELNTFTAVVYLKKVNHPGPGQPVPAAAEGEHGSGH